MKVFFVLFLLSSAVCNVWALRVPTDAEKNEIEFQLKAARNLDTGADGIKQHESELAKDGWKMSGDEREDALREIADLKRHRPGCCGKLKSVTSG